MPGSPDNGEILTEIAPDQPLSFACGPHLPCFGVCCRELALPVSPYDALRLRRCLQVTPDDFISRYLRIAPEENTGLPLAWLLMRPDSDGQCPFLTPAGCAVYGHRPQACRCYPLGSAFCAGYAGMRQKIYMLREGHCMGFDAGTRQPAAAWLDSQGVAPYAAAAQKLARLMALICASGSTLSPAQARMAMICLYRPQRLREITLKLRIFQRIRAGRHKAALVLEDSGPGDAAALDFGLDWLEMSIFGKCPGFF